MADLQTIIARMMGQKEEQGQQRRPPQQGRGIFGLPPQIQRDFSGDWFGQMGRDFRSGFDQTATNLRQGLPRSVIGAMDRSGVPGWQGIDRARSQADATAAGLQPPGVNPTPVGVPLAQALMPGSVNDVTAPPMPQQAVRRGMAPPSAPSGPSAAQLEEQAWRDAMARVRATRGVDPVGLRALAEEELAPLRRRYDRDEWRIVQLRRQRDNAQRRGR